MRNDVKNFYKRHQHETKIRTFATKISFAKFSFAFLGNSLWRKTVIERHDTVGHRNFHQWKGQSPTARRCLFGCRGGCAVVTHPPRQPFSQLFFRLWLRFFPHRSRRLRSLFFLFFSLQTCAWVRVSVLSPRLLSSHTFMCATIFFSSPFSTAASFFWPAFFYALFSALCAALFTLSLPPSWSASFFMPFSALYFATVVSNFFFLAFLI